MSITSRALASNEREHPLWVSILQTLATHLSPERARWIARQATTVRVTPQTLTLCAPIDCLRRWRLDGSLRALNSTLANLTDDTCQLAVIPNADGHVGPSLASFIASPANHAARERAHSLLRGEPARPLFIYGPGGSGKTHLMLAIGNELKQQADPERVFQLSAEEFSLELIAAIRENQLPFFRSRLQGAAALLVDDLGNLTGRQASQEELATILESLTARGIRVVLTAQRRPGDGEDWVPALRRQLARATELELRAPEWETRVAIVMDRIASWGLDVRPDVASLIVAKLGQDVRGLDSLLANLVIHPLCAGGLDDASVVRRILSHGARQTGHLSTDTVLGVVTRHFNLRLSDLRSAARSPRITTPRQIAMYLVRKHCGLSYPEIGQRFRRHHTTALHACRQIEQRRDHNASLHSTLDLLEKELRRVAESAG